MFDIYKIIEKLKCKRQVFTSESDLQLELAWIIKEEYPNAKVRLEYCLSFDLNMHIDILVIYNNKWIPIELKYKTKGCKKIINDEIFNLKNHGAKDVNCYLYLKDIQRIERIKENEALFEKGYTIFITNDMTYIKKPSRIDCFYSDFSLEDGIVKKGYLNWKDGTSVGTKKNAENPIDIKEKYIIKWENYCKIDDTNTGLFKILINEIR